MITVTELARREKQAELQKQAFKGTLAKMFGRGAKAAPAPKKMGLAKKLLLLGGAGTAAAGAAGATGLYALGSMEHGKDLSPYTSDFSKPTSNPLEEALKRITTGWRAASRS